MTTRINVNVDQAALLQRSREQTQANRLGFLEGQNRKKVEAEARRQRDANRAARGLTANGSMYNNRLRPLPQRPDPAAWRTGVTLGYFWFDEFYQVVNGLSYRYFKLAPGVGGAPLQIGYANATLISQLEAERSTHIPPATHIPGGPGLALSEAYQSGNAKYWAYRDLSCTPVGSVSLPNPKYPGFMQPETLSRSIYQHERVLVTQDLPVTAYECLLFLPLGGGDALFVAYRHEAGAEVLSTVRERRQQTPYQIRVGTVNELLVDYSFTSVEGVGTSSTSNSKEQEDIVCVRVSHNSVQQISPPAGLLTRLREKRGVTAVAQSERSYERVFGNSNATIGGVCFTQGLYDPLQNQFSGFGNTIYYTVQAPARSNSQQMVLDPYGIFYQGRVVFSNSATPAAWYDLDRASSSFLSTHEQYQALATQNITMPIASALQVKNYLGQPTAYFPSDIASGNVTKVQYRRAATSFSGSAYEENYLYANSAAWKAANVNLKTGLVGTVPFENAQPYLIYDWGNPALCRQQAAFYGIGQ